MDAARKHNDNWTWQAWKLLEPVKFVGSDVILWFILADRAVFRGLSALSGHHCLGPTTQTSTPRCVIGWGLYVVWHQKGKCGMKLHKSDGSYEALVLCARPCEWRVSSRFLSALRMWKCCCRALFLPLLRASTNWHSKRNQYGQMWHHEKFAGLWRRRDVLYEASVLIRKQVSFRTCGGFTGHPSTEQGPLLFQDRKPLARPDSSQIYTVLPKLAPRRPHEASASAFFIYGIIHIHIGCQLCCVQRLDMKRNKPVRSGEGSRKIKRFKAPFAHEYLMPIWGESDWSSVRSRRCRRKSTLSASGHCSTVPCIHGLKASLLGPRATVITKHFLFIWH